MNLLPFELPILDASNEVLLVHVGTLRDAMASFGAEHTGVPPALESTAVVQSSVPFLQRQWLCAGLI